MAGKDNFIFSQFPVLNCKLLYITIHKNSIMDYYVYQKQNRKSVQIKILKLLWFLRNFISRLF